MTNNNKKYFSIESAALFEIEQIKDNIWQFLPYRGITDIIEIKKVIKFYKKLISRHRTEAFYIISTMKKDTIYSLPVWIHDYLWDSETCSKFIDLFVDSKV